MLIYDLDVVENGGDLLDVEVDYLFNRREILLVLLGDGSRRGVPGGFWSEHFWMFACARVADRGVQALLIQLATLYVFVRFDAIGFHYNLIVILVLVVFLVLILYFY